MYFLPLYKFRITENKKYLIKKTSRGKTQCPRNRRIVFVSFSLLPLLVRTPVPGPQCFLPTFPRNRR